MGLSLFMRRLISILLINLLPAIGFMPAMAQTAYFTLSPASGCNPTAVYFTDSSFGPVSSYNWNFGNSTTSTLQSPSTTYSAPGVYNVTLTVNGPGGPSTYTSQVTIYDKPVISFTGTSTTGCSPLVTQFNATITPNSPGPVSYTWDFGDGTTDTNASPTHSYSVAGNYSVSLTVSNGAGCSQYLLKPNYLTVNPLPNVDFSVNNRTFCDTPATAIFTNASTGSSPIVSTSWLFGGIANGSGSPASYTFHTGGAFTILMTATDANGCSNTATKVAFVSVITSTPTFSAPAALCFGDLATFANTTLSGSNTSWKFGDGDSTTGENVTHFYATPGTYTVKMTTLLAGCPKSVTKSITINPRPNINLSITPPYPCPPPSSITLSAHATNAQSYVYKDGKGNIISTQDSFVRYYNGRAKMDTITLVVTSSAGCVDSIYTDTIAIRDLKPIIDPYDIGYPGRWGCIPLECDFDVVLWTTIPLLTMYPLPATAWSWTYGPGQSSSLARPIYIYNRLGYDTVKCIVTTANGCTSTGTSVNHIDSQIHPSFYATPLSACTHDTITFYNTTGRKQSGLIYNWAFTEAAYSTPDTIPVKYAYYIGNRQDTVILSTDNNNCFASSIRADYITIHPPSAYFTDTVFCPPSLKVQLNDYSGAATSLLWDFGDGTSSTLSSQQHTFPGSGTYKVRLTAYNSTYNCSDYYEREIKVIGNPGMNFKASDTTICLGDTVTFMPYYIGNGVVQYSFIFDGLQTPFYDTTSFGFPHLYTNRGFHDVSLIVSSGNGCLDTLKRTNYILVSKPHPIIKVTPVLGCPPLLIHLHDSSTNTPTVPTQFRRWIFSNKDTLFSGPLDTTYTFTNRGDYDVLLTVEDSLGCFDSLRIPNMVSVRKPVAIFTTPKDTVCRDAPVLFNSVSVGRGPLRYDWDFGDHQTDTGIHPTHRFKDTGFFVVRMIAHDTVGCADTFRHTLYSNAPAAAFSLSDSLSVCPTIIVQFHDSSFRAVSYRWNFGDGNGPVLLPNPQHTYHGPGQFNVYEVVYNLNGCTDTARSVVRVLGYNGGFAYAPLIGCVPMQVQFNPPVKGIPVIIWDFSDGNTITTLGTAIGHTYLNAGKRVPKVIFSDGGNCKSSSIGLDTILTDQVTAAFTWGPPCIDTAFILTQTSKGVYYAPNDWYWFFGTGDSAKGPTPAYTYHSTGNPLITLIVQNSLGCRDTIRKQVLVNPLPIIKSSGDKGLCPGDSTHLSAKGGITYQWYPASLVSCVNCDTTLVYIQPQTIWYYVKGTDQNGCANWDSARVYVQLKTTDSVGTGGSICIGDHIRLFASGADHYTWLPEESLDSPHIANPLASPTNTTTYLLIAQEGTCKVDSEFITVGVNSLPIFSAGPDQVIGRGTAVTLHPTQLGIDHIIWRTDSSLSCTDCFLPNAHPRYTHTYYATGYDKNGCASSDSVTVFVRCNGALVFIPNTFSPNGDGNNDYFYPRGEGVDQMSVFRIFDRWGEMVYERLGAVLNDQQSGWDGTYRGKALPPDVYVYLMQSRCEDGSVVSWKGDISLIR